MHTGNEGNVISFVRLSETSYNGLIISWSLSSAGTWPSALRLEVIFVNNERSTGKFAGSELHVLGSSGKNSTTNFKTLRLTGVDITVKGKYFVLFSAICAYINFT